MVKSVVRSIGPWLHAVWDSDTAYSFRNTPTAIIGALVTLVLVVAALFAPFVAPHNPLDSAAVDLMNSLLPPAWAAGGEVRFLLGTDNQGHDVLSAIIYGIRISMIISVAAVLLSVIIGVALGLLSGWVGGWIDAVIMRIADVQLSFPAILVALLIDGIARSVLGQGRHEQVAVSIIIISIGLSGWVQYARTVRGVTMIERTRDYVNASLLIGIRPVLVVVRHILPNVIGPVLVIATIHLATAIIVEATLSFLGLGMPPTQPSLGTLIRIGNDFLFSGEWWITIFPGVALVLLVLAVNLLGDWLRDALNPKLR